MVFLIGQIWDYSDPTKKTWILLEIVYRIWYFNMSESGWCLHFRVVNGSMFHLSSRRIVPLSLNGFFFGIPKTDRTSKHHILLNKYW